MTLTPKDGIADNIMMASHSQAAGAAQRPLKVTYVSWAESCSRSDHTARELGGTSHMIYLPRLGSKPSTVLFKYLGQWMMTSRLLRRERPDAVFTMTPPVFAALPAFVYAWWHRKQVVLDAHSAAFLFPRWRHFQWLQLALCRRAATTLVSNDHLARLVREGGAHATLVPDVPIVFAEREDFPRSASFMVAVVCSFDVDEPIAEILDAARQLPDVHFFMTGNVKHLSPALRANFPANVTLTGFISTAAYGGLLSSADVVLALTTVDHTMLRSAYEAIYQGTPVIVSNWPLLQQEFADGAVHVDNTAADIARGIATVRQDRLAFRAGAARLREWKLARWSATRASILARLKREAVETP